ncbi:uncharacterized protein MEPE_02311 [Melanopsichium pennsylvanicum]|uniref:Uncharacterized protein n=1 Tax=Melanopsichium pennsylvanicum TaxID=63383 RepID=A0AAJ4XJ55_9BASI|nr:uncharacterized protein MEPE_02311 [Melanopsichium pennsylvanicum]
MAHLMKGGAIAVVLAKLHLAPPHALCNLQESCRTHVTCMVNAAAPYLPPTSDTCLPGDTSHTSFNTSAPSCPAFLCTSSTRPLVHSNNSLKLIETQKACTAAPISTPVEHGDQQDWTDHDLEHCQEETLQEHLAKPSASSKKQPSKATKEKKASDMLPTPTKPITPAPPAPVTIAQTMPMMLDPAQAIWHLSFASIHTLSAQCLGVLWV